jgi:hypothetical protein
MVVGSGLLVKIKMDMVEFGIIIKIAQHILWLILFLLVLLLHIRHSCDNPSCINPDHLELGSHADNMKDKSIRERVHGEKNPNAKYTDEVRAMAKQWTGTLKEFTSLTGMSGPYLSTLRKNMSKFA